MTFPSDAAVDERAELPAAAAGIGLVGLFGGGAGAAGLGVVTALLGLPALLRLVMSQAVLWGGLVGACVVVSRRYGTGDVRTDLGATLQPSDVVRGLVVSWIARVVAGILVLPFVLTHQRLGSNTRLFSRFDTGLGVFVVATIAVVGAPIVEELFFRGLLQRSLESSLGVGGAIAAQGALFGLAHVNPLLGVANVSLVLALAGVGVTFGVVANRYHRLGPTMAGHAWFNLAAVLAALGTR